jgi:hypothetical protein
MAKRSNGRGGRKSWQALSRDVDKAARIKPAAKVHKSAKPRKGKAAPPADPMDREVPVKLGKEAIKIRENELAEKVLLRERLQQELRDSNKAKRGEIEALSARIHELAQTCADGVDNVRQGDLRFGEAAADAAKIPGNVAKGIEEAALEAGALPSEPHKFASTGGSAGTCGKCGRPRGRPYPPALHTGG